VPEAMAADLIAVVREGVTNAAKHASATDTTVSVRVEAGVVSIVIEDDGVGPGDSPRRSGVANLLARAQKWHGASSLIPRASGGSRLEWTAPISEESQ
jgi:signal transduction histidine kinase